MKTLLRYIKIYLILIPQYIKVRMQYRADFFVGMLGIVVLSISGILFMWMVFGSIPSLKGWSFYEILFLNGFFIIAMIPQQLFFNHFWSLGHQLQTGLFIRYYFRPINMMFYFISWDFDLKGFFQLFIGFSILIFANNNLSINWSPAMILLLFINWVSAALIMIAIIVAGMSSAFWIINANSLTMTISTLRDFAGYPLDIFNKTFQVLFTILAPIGFIAFYPCSILLRPISEVPAAAWFTPLVGPFLFLLSCLLWAKGINSYSGTGS